MRPVLLTKADCVRRARNLNQQAIAYRLSGRPLWYRSLISTRNKYMTAARLFA